MVISLTHTIPLLFLIVLTREKDNENLKEWPGKTRYVYATLHTTTQCDTVSIQAMLQRLEKVQPTYCITDWIDDWQRSEELAQRITTYPTPSPTRSKSACRGTRSATPHGMEQSSGEVSEKLTIREGPEDRGVLDRNEASEKQSETT